jgi:hypothetical protein
LAKLVQEQSDLVEKEFFILRETLERILNFVTDAFEAIAKRDIGLDFFLRHSRWFHLCAVALAPEPAIRDFLRGDASADRGRFGNDYMSA